ncbi:MAG: class II glutamine amidotransferase [Candidatus Omnitrophica bacterium]|nr:class II glutamine amidotransferase [Candidatus Omnitrophota bacterium]
MRGNVFQGIPKMLHLMLTGGYDGAGVSIKFRLNGHYHIITEKDVGHLDALIKSDFFGRLERKLIEAVAQEYGVAVSEVRPLHDAPDDAQARLEKSFDIIDPEFGESVMRMRVGGSVNQIISIPMEGIGHTRWSTQGKPAKRNSHPHHKRVRIKLPDGRWLEVVLAHNGNYESFSPVQHILRSMEYEIEGDTDSEVLDYVVALMHATQQEGEVVSLQQAVQRAFRFIKYTEDRKALIDLLENQTSEALNYHDPAAELLKEELRRWEVAVPEAISSQELVALAKSQGDDLIYKALNSPWNFDPSDWIDLSRRFVERAEPMPGAADAKRQKEVMDARNRLQQRFFDPTYSSIAIAAMNNNEEGVVVARGRTGGDLEVYAPPLLSIAERLNLLIPKMEAEPLPADGEEAQARWLEPVSSLLGQVRVLLEAVGRKDLLLSHAEVASLRRHEQRLSQELDKINRVQFGPNIEHEKAGILQLFESVRDFAAEHAPVHDPGKRVAASERRAIPGIPGTYHDHPDPLFRAAGRGETDTYSVGMGQVVHIARTIRREGVWEDELAPPDDVTPDLRVGHTAPALQMVDVANLELGGAQSRLEREIANGFDGWSFTVSQFKDGKFPHLNYTDDELKQVEEWIFVAEGSSELVAQVVAEVGKAVPTTTVHFDVVTGKRFQEMVASGKIEFLAKELAQRGKRIMVAFVSNTGQTETIRRGATALNKANRFLGAVDVPKKDGRPGEMEKFDARALPCCITNVAGSAVDNEVTRFNGWHHAIYTLVGYEMAVPATNSISVGTASSGLFETYLLAIQDAFRDPESGRSTGKLEFNRRLDKVFAAARDINKILVKTEDGSLKLTKDYQRSVEDVLGRIDPVHLDDLIWITGWWIFYIAALETRLKFQEGFRSKGVHAFDIITGKHGPYAILRAGANVIVFLPNSKAFKSGSDQILQGINEIRPRIDPTEGGGKQGNLIVIMDQSEVYGELGAKVAEKADVVIGLPHMDDPFTGYMFSMLFVQLLTLYGARQRYEPIRQRLFNLNGRIRASGVLGFEQPGDG